MSKSSQPKALSNVDAIYREYPFLERILPRTKAHQVTVSRFSMEVLNGKSSELYPFYPTDQEFYLIDQYGNLVSPVGVKSWWRAFDKKERVGQTLARIGSETKRVHYGVHVGGWNGELTLYKLPKGFESAADWLDSMVAKDLKVIRSF